MAKLNPAERSLLLPIGLNIAISLIVATFIVILPILLVQKIRAFQCQVGTFYVGLFGDFANKNAVLIALMLQISSAALIGSYVVFRPHMKRKQIRQRGFAAITVAVALAWGVSYGDEIESYYCLSPSTITLSSGLLRTPKHLGWDEVDGVMPWCWQTAGHGLPQLGATLRFSLVGGEQLTVGLVDGEVILTGDYLAIRTALQGRHYDYRLDQTVRPDLCPPALYPLLQHG